MSHSPDFIPQHPPVLDPQMPPPYRFDNVGMRIFIVPAKAVKLQQVCKHFFNDIAVREGLDFRINPIVDLSGDSFVYLELLSYPRIASQSAGQNNLGFVTQNEFLVSIPVVYENLYGLPLEVGMFTPFLFVDNDWSLIAGREVIGYPKVDGKFAMDADPSKILNTKVRANALHQFGPNAPVRYEDVFEILAPSSTEAQASAAIVVPDGGTALEDYWPFGPVPELFGPAGDNRVDDEVYELMLASAGVKLTNYTMKQFRDAVDPAKACYQQILDSEMKVSGVSGGGVYSDLKLMLYRHDSLEIAARLGIDAPNGELSPTFGFWYTANMTLDEIGSLYGSCEPGGEGVGGGTDGGTKSSDDDCDTVSGHDCVKIVTELCALNMRLYTSFATAWIDVVSGCVKPRKR